MPCELIDMWLEKLTGNCGCTAPSALQLDPGSPVPPTNVTCTTLRPLTFRLIDPLRWLVLPD